MKKSSILLLVLLAMAFQAAEADIAPSSACGNNSTGGVGGAGNITPSPDSPGKNSPNPGPTPAPPQDKGDPVVPYTGNEFKRVDDLQIWGSPGALPMVWSRHSNSRAVPGMSLFGMAHYWRHSYQWELSRTTDDVNGRRRVQLIYPDGALFLFVETAPGTWEALSALTDRIEPVGDGFRLLRTTGTRILFERTPSAHHFLATRIDDAFGNAYTLQYDASRRLIKVTEPGGQFFSLTYRTLNGNLLHATRLTTLSSVPEAGQWVEMPISDARAFRYVRLIQADKSFGQIAEVEFLEAGTGEKLSGTIISSDSFEVARLAFDGNPETGFVSTSQSGGFVGLDLGAARQIGMVRFRSLPGKEALHRPPGSSFFPVCVHGGNEVPVTTVALASATTSDGRSATYEYSDIVDPSLPYVFPALTSVRFSDGTRSNYRHVQVFPGTRPLISEWDDVRYSLRQGRYKTIYQNERHSAVFGAVYRQVNVETGRPILTLGGSLHRPMVTYANGGAEVQFYQTNLPTGAAITQESDANGNITRYTYHSSGYLATKTDPLGRVNSYTWDPQGRPLTVLRPDGSSESWSYNADGHLLSYTDELGRTTTYTRDERNRIARIDYPDGSFEEFTRNEFGLPLTHRLRNGGVVTSSYDPSGLLLEQTDPMGNVSTFAYDAARRPTSVTDALGRVTQMEYDDRGNLTRRINPDGTERLFTYTPYGDLATETDELGATWQYSYDIFRRVTSVTDPLGRTAHTEYLADTYHKAPLATTSPSGLRSTFTYDKAWNLLTQTAAAGTPHAATTTIAYDKVNNPVRVTDAAGRTSSFTYDVRNRRISATDPLGHTSAWNYDAAGNVLTETRPDGGITTNAYDAMNRLTQTTDPKGQTTRMAYNPSGSVASMTDPRGNSYSWQYDLLDRPTRKNYPGGASEFFAYDAVGNPVSYTTRAGQIRTSVFDSRNREIQTLWSDSTPDISRSFDLAGRVLSEDNGLAALTYAYDAAGQLRSETTAQTNQPDRTVAYTYDADGRLASTTYPGGNVVTNTYTPRSQVAEIGLDGAQLAAYTYTPMGRISSKVLENGTTATYSYDAAHRLLRLEHRKGTSAPLAAFDYELDSVGNRTRLTRSGLHPEVENYAYDPVDQLVEARYGVSRTVTYQYDAAGNRQWRTDGGITTNYTANPDNAYTQIGGGIAAIDPNGNHAGTPGTTYTYDAQNRLVAATVNGVTTTFAYDARNRVIQRTHSTSSGFVTTHLTYDRWNLIEERGSTGELDQVYVHGAAIDELLVKFTQSGPVYYHHDGLGSTIALTGETGQVVESYTYDAFGAASVYDSSFILQPSSLQSNRFLFTGREFIPETGLYDYRNRVYSPDLGRFLQTDPIRFSAGDINLYRYVSNNPISRRDPWGLDEKKTDDDENKDDEEEDDEETKPRPRPRNPLVPPGGEPGNYALADPNLTRSDSQQLIDDIWNKSTPFGISGVGVFGAHEHYGFIGESGVSGPFPTTTSLGGYQGQHQKEDPPGTVAGVHSHWTNNGNPSSQDKMVAKSRGRSEYIITKGGITRVNSDGTTNSFNRDGTPADRRHP